tara:strand:- start:1260 stop:1508 length:249 start_codon:yes stop_codon:yes gene_type:complete
MKWLVVVVFANIMGDVYIFTEPSFDSHKECYATLTQPEEIKKYTQKLVEEYGGLIPIKAVNCLSEKEIENILKSLDKDSKSI